jgi:HNH endonuclease
VPRKTPAQRFAALVNTAGPWSLRHNCPGRCHLWTGGNNGKGYGTFSYEGRTVRAYRWIYTATHGPNAADGLDIDHKCRRRACVNPAHLEAVPHRVNVLRSTNHVAQRAAQTHCSAGHPFDATNTRRRSNGTRQCRACARTRRTKTPERTAA